MLPRLASLLFIAAAFSSMLVSQHAQAAQAKRPPNIVLILIDDMGWRDLGCYGHAFHETPHIDRLAAEGVRFTNFYATPVCSSTRCTIESGQSSARVGITDFLPGHWKRHARLIVPPMPGHLDHDLTTPGEALGKAGYVTGYFGKWHLGNGPANAPDKHGYQVTAATLGAAFRERQAAEGNAGPKRMNQITQQAIHFLQEHAAGERPFFLHLSHRAVHIPIQAEPATIQKYAAKEKPAEGVNHPVYAAMIENLDAQVGEFLKALSLHGAANNTIVIVASDNGGLHEVYTGNGQIVSTNAPLRAEKGTIYEGGVRVPCIVRWPGVAPAGQTCDAPAASWDLLPTFCSMAHIAPPRQPLDGVDLTPAIRDPGQRLPRESIYIHYPHYHHSRPASAMRRGDLKLIEWLESGDLELYDLSRDPGEANNLAAAMPDQAEQLRGELHAWRKQVGARMPTPNPEFDESKADIWYDRKSGEPLDLKAFGDRLERAASKPYFRTGP